MHTQSQVAGLQLQDVNPAYLDSLVLDYLAAEDFVEDDNAEAEKQLVQRLAAFAAYQQLQQGNVCNAMAIAAQYCPAVLEDQRLAFRLKRQQFIELLRQETAEGDSAALACAREDLAPLALHAYPEAFLDFKKTLLMLVDTQQQQQQPAAQSQRQQQQQHQHEWSLEARKQLAETLYHTMMLQMGCQQPSLLLLSRYLLHIYQQHTSAGSSSSSRSRGSSSRGSSQQQVQQLMGSKGGKVAQGLLLEGREEGPLPPDVSGQQLRGSDVQALMAAVGLQRRECEDALKLTGGDVAAALAHQLARLRLNNTHLDALVWEYATARGLLEPADGPEAVAAAIAAAAAAPLTVTDDMDIDSTAQDNTQPSAAAAADMPPPASRTGKRNKAAISSSSGANQPGSSDSPFRLQLGAAAEGFGVSAAGFSNTPGSGLEGAGLNRSASQSPPYKAPRYRRKQTPSRFYSAAAEGPSLQEQQQHAAAAAASSELQQVVVVSDAGASQPPPQPVTSLSAHNAAMNMNGTAAATAAASGPAPTAAKKPSPPRPLQPPSCPPSARQSSGSDDGGSGDTVQHLVTAARAAAQQQRWQQLQQQLKGGAAASGGTAGAGSAGAGSLADQLEAQDQLQGVQVLLQQQRFDEVEGRLVQLLPGLLQEQPLLMFELKRCQFTALVESNQLPTALQFARSQLTPLADKHPELLPALKASMALLLPGITSSSSGSSSSSAAALGQKLWEQLLPLLQAKLGIESPQLVSLLQVLLTAHKAWFVRQRCSDPFAATLNIHKLLAAPPATAAAGAAAAEQQAEGSSRGAAAAAGSRRDGVRVDNAAGIAARIAAGAAHASSLAGAATHGPSVGRDGGAGVELVYYPGMDVFAEAMALEVQGAGGSGGGGEEEDEEGAEVDEAAVLQVMEVLELPRGTALELLAENGGDPQAVIMAVLGG